MEGEVPSVEPKCQTIGVHHCNRQGNKFREGLRQAYEFCACQTLNPLRCSTWNFTRQTTNRDTLLRQVGSDHLEGPSAVLQSGEPLPLNCDGEIDWTLFSFSHGFRQPRAVILAAAAANAAAAAAASAASSDANLAAAGAPPA